MHGVRRTRYYIGVVSAPLAVVKTSKQKDVCSTLTCSRLLRQCCAQMKQTHLFLDPLKNSNDSTNSFLGRKYIDLVFLRCHKFLDLRFIKTKLLKRIIISPGNIANVLKYFY